MHIVLRIPGSDTLKVLRFENARAASEALIQYLDAPEPPEMYRVIITPGEDIRLRRLRVRPGSEVTEQRVVSAEFEDDV